MKSSTEDSASEVHPPVFESNLSWLIIISKFISNFPVTTSKLKNIKMLHMVDLNYSL